jgi:hypothetical protein
MIVGHEYGGLRRDEHDALLKMIDDNGWSHCGYWVETVDKCATGVVTVRMVQKELRKEYDEKYRELDGEEVERGFSTLCWRHTKK